MSREPRHLRASLGPPGRGGPREGFPGQEWPQEQPTLYREREGGRRGRRSWGQRLVLTVLASIVVLCLAGASVGGYVLVKVNSIDRVGNLSLDQPPAGEPENFLVVGVDTRGGHATNNTDTIMVARVDPESDRLALTSFPRDLMVTIADTGEIGMVNSAYDRSGEGAGEQNLIDTLRQNFGIPINHFVEVNFESFRRVVDAVGGVSLWFPTPVRDRRSQLQVDRAGCVKLGGHPAL